MSWSNREQMIVLQRRERMDKRKERKRRKYKEMARGVGQDDKNGKDQIDKRERN